MILDAEPDITVVGEAADGRAAVDVVLRRRPDVVLMDIRMPELDGLQAARRMLDAVRVVAAGEALLAPSITRRLITQFARSARPEPGTVPAVLAELTARELEVLRSVARGLSHAEIAAELMLVLDDATITRTKRVNGEC